MAVELTLPMLDGGVLPDTVMTHALVGALVGIVEMLLVAPFLRFRLWNVSPLHGVLHRF